jgi:hypothetical protein
LDADIADLVTSGATTLISLMVTDAWGRAKEAATSLFTRRQPALVDSIETELEETRHQVLTAREANDSQTEVELMLEWKSRLRRAVATDPDLITELGSFVSKYGVSAVNANDATIQVIGNASDRARIYQQGQGTQHNRR